MVQAAKHCTQDVGIWQWASRPSPGTPPIFSLFYENLSKFPPAFVLNFCCISFNNVLPFFSQSCTTSYRPMNP